MGKYTKLVESGVLPKLPVEKGDFQDKVEAYKTELLKEDSELLKKPINLSMKYRETRDEKDALEKQVKALNVKIEALEQMLETAYEAQELHSLSFAGGINLAMHPEPIPKVEDKEAFRRWCLAEGFEKQMVLHSSTVKGLVADRLLEGLPLPTGVRAFFINSFTLRGR